MKYFNKIKSSFKTCMSNKIFFFFEFLECEQLNLKGKIDTTHSIQFQGINFLMCTFFCLIQGYYGFNKKRMKINNV
jgi:hypothetical protein